MLRISKISFPGLGIETFDVNSVAFEIFGMEIAWYAVLITLGMVCAVVYTIYQARKIGITTDDVIDFALFTIPIGVIGARLYYVMTKLEDFDTFWDVINIRSGGLAIYGGIIAGGLTVLTVCYFKKINFFAFADCVSPGVIIAQGVGRWGNFMNGEAFGDRVEDLFCRMGLQNQNTAYTFGTSEMVYVHPTFLYESLWNIAGFLLAAFLTKKKKYDGQIFLIVFGWYGLGRMFIEGLRTDSLYIPGTELRISQVLAAAIFIVCSALLIYLAIKKPTVALYHKAPKDNKNCEAVAEGSKLSDSIKALLAKVIDSVKGILDKLKGNSEEKNNTESPEDHKSEDDPKDN